MLEHLRAQIRALLDERAARQAELDDVLAGVAARNATDLDDAETARFAEARDRLGVIDADRARLDERVAELETVEARRADAEAAAAALAVEPRTPRPAGGARVVAEARTYTAGNRDRSFFADAYRARFGEDYAARERLQRHMQEAAVEARANGHELRDVGTAAFGALVVPQFLTDLYAPNVFAGRPFLNTVRNVPLTEEGMTAEIPRGTTAAATAIQATQNSGVQETDFDETTLSVPVRTIAGQQDVSRQALERGRMVDEIIYGDLVESYATVANSQAINADGTSGTHLGVLATVGINAVTFTTGSPTAALLYPKIADAVQRINGLRFMPATAIVMHPRRWGFLTAALDGSSRPLVSLDAPQNPMGVGRAAEYGQVVGSILGLPVITDASIPTNLGGSTNEDRIIVLRASDTMFMEEAGAPSRLKFEETTGGSLTTKLVVYGYSAFTAGRYPASISVVAGTGLTPPAF